MNQWKKNLPIIVGIALPILLVIAVALAIYIPRWMADPQYDFVYLVQEQRHDRCYQYEVEDGALTRTRHTERVLSPERDRYVQEPVPLSECTQDVTFYVYDVSEHTSTERSFDEVQKLNLAERSSPDGYRVAYDYGHNGIFELLGSDDRDGWYAHKDGVRLKLDMQGVDGSRYRNDVEFMGWVVD